MIPQKCRPQVPGPTFALALGLVAFIAPLAVHLFFPVIPAVKVALGLSEAAAQFNFSIALFAMALATLAYGSLSDLYGRRPLLLSGLLLFLLGSAVSAVAPGATALALGRIVQAVGAGCSMTLVRTIARDAYRAEYLVRAIAYLTMFYTLGPMIAPLFGGVLIDTLGWRSVFGFALIVGVFIAIAAYAWIFETRPQLSVEPSETGIVRGYAELLRKPQFVGYVLQSGFNTAAFMTMASASAMLMKELLERSSTEFGLYFLVFPVGFFFVTGCPAGSATADRARGWCSRARCFRWRPYQFKRRCSFPAWSHRGASFSPGSCSPSRRVSPCRTPRSEQWRPSRGWPAPRRAWASSRRTWGRPCLPRSTASSRTARRYRW